MPIAQNSNHAGDLAEIRTFVELYIRERETGVETTTRGRINDFTHFQQFCLFNSIHRLTDVTPALLYEFIAHREKERDSPRTILRRFHNVRALLKYAVHRNVLPFNPAQYVKEPSIPYSEPKYLNAEQKRSVRIEGIPSEWNEIRYAMAIEIMIAAGLRIGETLAIKQRSVDVLTMCLVDIIGKGRKLCTVALPDSLHDLLIAYLQARNHEIESRFPEYRYMSPTQRGEYPFILSTYDADISDPDSFTFSDRQLRKLISRRDPDVHPHRLRHTFVKDFYEETKDPVLTRQAARHERLETTMRYAASNLEAIRAVQNRIKK